MFKAQSHLCLVLAIKNTVVLHAVLEGKHARVLLTSINMRGTVTS